MPVMEKLSIVIPTLNEAANIRHLIHQLKFGGAGRQFEIIVVDGGSSDATVSIINRENVQLLLCPQQGRAIQMNLAAESADGDVLYFVHGDTIPPLSYYADIENSIKMGFDMGCFRFRFDNTNPLLKINAFFTRFNRSWVRGGDQSLFIKRSVFEELGKFKEEFVIMEDFDLLRRAKGRYSFQILPSEITVSARKYENNSYLRVQFANLVVFNMFRMGYAPQKLLNTYRRLIDYRS